MQGKYQIKTPKDETELTRYYDLRYKVLCKPWEQPFEASKDTIEDTSFHKMIVDENDNVIAVGRVNMVTDKEARIKYIAVDENYQKQGLGAKIVLELENVAMEKGAEEMMLYARESSAPFYEKHGYTYITEAPYSLYNGVIKLMEYRKKLHKRS